MSEKPKRVQFDFTPESLERVEAIKTRVGSPDLAGVLKEALKYYEWVLTVTGYDKNRLTDLVYFVNTEFYGKKSRD